MEKELKIQVPEGYEIDEENSTFGCIKFKEKKEIRTWEDFIKIKGVPDEFVELCALSVIGHRTRINADENSKEFNNYMAHVIAEYKIKLLMQYYGGELTKEEWENGGEEKYVILNHHNKIIITVCWGDYHLLVFHTKEQCENLLKYNEQLVKDYYMIDNVS